MYCQKCGKEIDNEAVVCIHCGCATKNQALRKEDSDVRTSGGLIALSILFPIVGIIMGIVYMQSYNETRRDAGRTYLKTALITWGVCFVIILFLAIISQF